MYTTFNQNLRKLARPAIWSLVLAATVYGASILISDYESIQGSMTKFGVTGWALILGLSLVNYFLRYLRWEYYLRQHGQFFPPIKNLAYYLAGFAFTTTPGKAGEAVRSFYLKLHGMSYTDSLGTLFAERLVDLVAMLILTLLGAITFEEYRWPILLIAILTTAIVIFICSSSVHLFIQQHMSRWPMRTARSLSGKFLDLVQAASILFRIRPLITGTSLAIIAWGAEGLALYIILTALGVDTTVTIAVSIYAISVLAGALTFIPGGLGSTEAVMIVLLKLIGADTSTAISATIICRLATLWFAVAIGTISMLYIEIQRQSARKSPREA